MSDDRITDAHLEWLQTEGSAAERKMATELIAWRRSRWLCIVCLRPECEGTHMKRERRCQCLIVDGERRTTAGCPSHGETT